MDTVRYTIVDANQKLVPTRGFETGRVYSGIRGVVPVFIKRSSSEKREHIGALEAGTSFTTLLNALKKEMGSEFCILLTHDHVTRNMWPDFVKTHFTEDRRYKSWFLESSTSSDTKSLLQIEALWDLFGSGVGSVFIRNPSPLQVCVFPLMDYRGSVQKNEPPVGSVFVWKSAAERWAVFRRNLINNIIYSVLALIVVESVLYITWQVSRKKLQKVIDDQTREINTNYNRLKNLMDSMPIGILVVLYETDKIIEANPEAARMFGIPPNAILGRSMSELIRKEAGKDEEDGGYLARTPDDRQVPVLKIEILTTLQGNEVKIISMADLTEQKEAEQERIRREKLQGVLEMAGAVCHELNQPLMVISGYSELLIKDLQERTDQHQMASMIKDQVDRMGEITNKLMKITRYKTKKYLKGHIIDIDEASSTKSRR